MFTSLILQAGTYLAKKKYLFLISIVNVGDS